MAIPWNVGVIVALDVHGQSHLTNKIRPYNSLHGVHNLVVSTMCFGTISTHELRMYPKFLYKASTIVHHEVAIYTV